MRITQQRPPRHRHQPWGQGGFLWEPLGAEGHRWDKGGPGQRGAWGRSAPERRVRSLPGDSHRAGPGEPEEEDAPSGITSLKKQWRSPKVQVTTASGDLGMRRRENNAGCLLLFFFLQCRRKEVASSFVQKHAPALRAAGAALQDCNPAPPVCRAPAAPPSPAALRPTAGNWPFWVGVRGWGDTPFPAAGTRLPASATLGKLERDHHRHHHQAA